MPDLELQFDDRQVREIQSSLSGVRDGLPKAQRGAINKTLTRGRTFVNRSIRNDAKLNVKARDVNKRIRLEKATAGKPDRGKLEVRGGRWKMHKLGGRPIDPPSQKGIPVSSRKKTSASPFRRRVYLPHHFVQEMPSGHKGIFTRKPGTRQIKEVYGPHLSKLIPKFGIDRKSQTFVQAQLSKELLSQVDRLLKPRANTRGNRSS